MQNNHPTLVNGHFNHYIPVLDRGFAYGDGVFRTLRIVNGQPDLWPIHYQKLVEDCSAIGIVCPDADLFMHDFELLFQPEDRVAVAKIIVTRGEGERGYTPPAITTPLRVMVRSEFPAYSDTNYTTGVDLYLCETRLGYQPKLAGVKHLNRLENVLARMEWHDPQLVDGVMLDIEDNVIECTSANLFARFDQRLITPKLDNCGVAGITRKRILSHAHTLQLKPSIESMPLKKLLSADEVFICNSLFGVWQVRSLAGQQWAKQHLVSDIRKMLNI